MKHNLKPLEIAKKIIKLSGINIFENTRKKNVVEMRALFSYLLREKLKMRWTNIALFFKSQGKAMNHATVMHSIKHYKMYKESNNKLKDIEKMFFFKSNLNIDEIDRVHYLENKCKNLQQKLEVYEASTNPLIDLISQIPKNREDEAIEKLELLLKGWKWKYSDKSTAYIGE